MSPSLSGRSVRKKRQKRRSLVSKVIRAAAACLGGLAALGCIFYALHRFDHLSKRQPVTGYVEAINTLREEYRHYYGDTLDPAGDVAQSFVRANEQMLRGDFDAAVTNLRR